MTGQLRPQLFDFNAVFRNRQRSLPLRNSHDILFLETAGHLMERLTDVRKDFAAPLVIGDGDRALVDQLEAKRLSARHAEFTADETLASIAGSFDLVLSNLNLHWINDLPGALIQIKKVLRPGGLFLAALPGGQTLAELRESLLAAELELSGGVSPRISPMIDASSASALMQRAGYELPVIDTETMTLGYSSLSALMHDLRGMGQANALVARSRRFASRALFARAEDFYRRHHTIEGQMVATFEILFLHGWRPELSVDQLQS